MWTAREASYGSATSHTDVPFERILEHEIYGAGLIEEECSIELTVHTHENGISLGLGFSVCNHNATFMSSLETSYALLVRIHCIVFHSLPGAPSLQYLYIATERPAKYACDTSKAGAHIALLTLDHSHGCLLRRTGLDPGRAL